MSFHSLSESPELLVHKWAKESRELRADRTLALSLSLPYNAPSPSLPELQSLCHTSGRLVKKHSWDADFHSICKLSVRFVTAKVLWCSCGVPVRAQSKCPPLPFHFFHSSYSTECSHCTSSGCLLKGETLEQAAWAAACEGDSYISHTTHLKTPFSL